MDAGCARARCLEAFTLCVAAAVPCAACPARAGAARACTWLTHALSPPRAMIAHRFAARGTGQFVRAGRSRVLSRNQAERAYGKVLDVHSGKLRLSRSMVEGVANHLCILAHAGRGGRHAEHRPSGRTGQRRGGSQFAPRRLDQTSMPPLALGTVRLVRSAKEFADAATLCMPLLQAAPAAVRSGTPHANATRNALARAAARLGAGGTSKGAARLYLLPAADGVWALNAHADGLDSLQLTGNDRSHDPSAVLEVVVTTAACISQPAPILACPPPVVVLTGLPSDPRPCACMSDALGYEYMRCGLNSTDEH